MRTSVLDNPEFARSVAELWVKGVSRKELAEKFDRDVRTISVWVRDPRVQAHARTMAIERVQRIARRIDGEIEARLALVSEWDTDMLLKVRKEYLERPLKIGAGDEANLSSATNEIAEAMDQSAEFATQLRALVEASRTASKK